VVVGQNCWLQQALCPLHGLWSQKATNVFTRHHCQMQKHLASPKTAVGRALLLWGLLGFLFCLFKNKTEMPKTDHFFCLYLLKIDTSVYQTSRNLGWHKACFLFKHLNKISMRWCYSHSANCVGFAEQVWQEVAPAVKVSRTTPIALGAEECGKNLPLCFIEWTNKEVKLLWCSAGDWYIQKQQHRESDKRFSF
jgi:hypothetical protein